MSPLAVGGRAFAEKLSRTRGYYNKYRKKDTPKETPKEERKTVLFFGFSKNKTDVNI